MSWRPEELEVIMQMFEWADIDNDNKLNRDDLLTSMNASDIEEIESLFTRLKGRTSPSDRYISFEEFSLNIQEASELIQKFLFECIDTVDVQLSPVIQSKFFERPPDFNSLTLDFELVSLLKQPLQIMESVLYNSIDREPPNSEEIDVTLKSLEGIIDKLFNMSNLGSLDNKATSALGMSCKNLLVILNNMINFYQSEKDRFTGLLSECRLECDETSEQRNKLETDKNKLIEVIFNQERVENAKEIEMSNLRSRSREYERKIEKIKEDRRNYQIEIEEKENSIDVLKNEINLLRNKISICEIQSVPKTIPENRIKRIKTKKTDFRKNTGLMISKDFFSIQEPEEKARKALVAIHKKNTIIANLNKEIDLLIDENQSIRNKIQEVEAQNQALTLKVGELHTCNHCQDSSIDRKDSNLEFTLEDELAAMGLRRQNTFRINNEQEIKRAKKQLVISNENDVTINSTKVADEKQQAMKWLNAMIERSNSVDISSSNIDGKIPGDFETYREPGISIESREKKHVCCWIKF